MKPLNANKLQIGIAELPSAKWSGGLTYTRMLMRSLGEVVKERGDVSLSLLSPSASSGLSSRQTTIQTIPYQGSEYSFFLPGEQRVRRLFRSKPKTQALQVEKTLRRVLRLPGYGEPAVAAAAENGVSVLLPMLDLPVRDESVKTIGWIPDFQHVYLPGLFSDEDRRLRDENYRRVAEYSDAVLLSSSNARDHFIAFAPEYASKAKVIPFPSLFAFEGVSGDIGPVQKRFHLPEKFALVVNQFWKHKNHLVVVDAVRRLRERNLSVPVVMVGMPADNRDPSNKAFSMLLQAVAEAGVADRIILLGQVEFSDLVDLLRSAAVIIQPSRFEGWSTTVEDAKALGRPLLCSDLPVHREQAPSSLGFFGCDDGEALADLLAQHWPTLGAGPDRAQELSSLQVEAEFARQHGLTLLRLCADLSGRTEVDLSAMNVVRDAHLSATVATP